MKIRKFGARFLSDTLLDRRERIQVRIKSLHLDNYFDKYETEVASFDAGGTPLDASEKRHVRSVAISTIFQKNPFKTKYGNLFFKNEVGNRLIKEYVDFINIYGADSSVIGYVVLDLRLRKDVPKSVYPELLVNYKIDQSPKTQQFSHAIYEHVPGSSTFQLKPGSGSFNYERRMPMGVLTNPELYEAGVTISDFRHLGIKGSNGRTLIMSSPVYPFGTVFANFSFFVSYTGIIGLLWSFLLYAVQYGFSRFSLNYSTRIQILLNLAFFLPLLLVVVIILGVISNNYVRNQETNYVSNTKNIAANFSGVSRRTFTWRFVAKEAMEQELMTIARDAENRH